MEKFKILFLISNYFMVTETLKAFYKLGHKVFPLDIRKEDLFSKSYIDRIISVIRDFRPDFVFSINQLGFDEQGMFFDLLRRLSIPFAIWFADHPILINSFSKIPEENLGVAFLWDRDYRQEVLNLGFEICEFLPLATDPDIFVKREITKEGVGFVGNSMIYGMNRWIKPFSARKDALLTIYEISSLFMKSPEKDAMRFAKSSGIPLGFLKDSEETNLYFSIYLVSTHIYRRSVIEKTLPFNPKIYGDPFWKKVIPEKFYMFSPSYYGDLPKIYPSLEININATSTQMKRGLNQRVFDVPACGGFLLTDYREELFEQFMRDEIAYYKDPEEIPDLLDFYLKSANIREKISKKARIRVLKEHTYTNRMKKVTDLMERNFFKGRHTFFIKKAKKSILLLGKGKELSKEIENASRSLGIHFDSIFFKKEESYLEVVSKLLEKIETVSPFFVLTVNMGGIDEEGVIFDILNSYGIPLCIWWVDSPKQALEKLGVSPNSKVDMFMFCWDRDHTEVLKSLGYRAYFLPLATDPNIFSPNVEKEVYDVSFVGNSYEKWTSKLEKISYGEIFQIVCKCAKFYLRGISVDPGRLLKEVTEIDKRFSFILENLDSKWKADIETSIIWRAANMLREDLICNLYGHKVDVFGDNGWKNFSCKNINFRGLVLYYNELLKVYQSSRINLNITSPQMKRGLNQRVFDVPCSLGFLLTDYKEDLEILFKPNEIAFYRDKDELRELVEFYLKNESARREIAKLGRKRILSSHTYKNRLEEILKTLKFL